MKYTIKVKFALGAMMLLMFFLQSCDYVYTFRLKNETVDSVYVYMRAVEYESIPRDTSITLSAMGEKVDGNKAILARSDSAIVFPLRVIPYSKRISRYSRSDSASIFVLRPEVQLLNDEDVIPDSLILVRYDFSS